MALRPLLDLLFPAQCASCNAIGGGLCSSCAPSGETILVRFPGLAVTALGPYEDGLRAAVLALKDGRRDVAEALGSAVAHLIAPRALLVPIPTTAKRRRVRGMDGVALVAGHAAAIAGAGVIPALEQRSGDAQRGRSRMQRLAARGRFVCHAASVAGKRVTLFDDVCTTGSTLRDCATALREAGGLVEDAVVIAVAKSRDPWGEPNRN
jgi:predicted amidophosphoribosyltransferase